MTGFPDRSLLAWNGLPCYLESTAGTLQQKASWRGKRGALRTETEMLKALSECE